MEEQKSIKETLQQGAASGDKTKKKLVIKKKPNSVESKASATPVEPRTGSSTADNRKKDLNELIREEAKRQGGLGSGPQAPSQASPIVSRPERKREELPEVIHSISFNINHCEKIGVVGRTGSGKSTLTLGLLRIMELVENN